MNPPVKMKLRSRGIIPHGGYFRIVDPLTGVRVAASNWDHLVSQVRDERKANGAAIGTELESEIEDWVCANHPEEAIAVDPRMPPIRSLNLDDIVTGTKTFLAFKAAGSPLVSEEEAERRAQICARCPRNLSWSQNCSICSKVEDAIQLVVGTRRTSVGQQLFACNLCGCSNKVQVHFPLEIMLPHLSEEKREQFAFAKEAWNCWKG